jgi:hypothetical protein
MEKPAFFSQFTSQAFQACLVVSVGTRSRSHRPKAAASPRGLVAKSNRSRTPTANGTSAKAKLKRAKDGANPGRNAELREPTNPPRILTPRKPPATVALRKPHPLCRREGRRPSSQHGSLRPGAGSCRA